MRRSCRPQFSRAWPATAKGSRASVSRMMIRASGASFTPPRKMALPAGSRFSGLSGSHRKSSESRGRLPAKEHRYQPLAGQRAATVRAAGPSAIRRASRKVEP